MVRFECIACRHLFRSVTEDDLPERNDTPEVCPRCGMNDTPWVVWPLKVSGASREVYQHPLDAQAIRPNPIPPFV